MLEERIAAVDVLKLSDGIAAARAAGGGGGGGAPQQRNLRSGIYQRASDDEDSDFD